MSSESNEQIPDISGMEIIIRDPSAGITRRRKPPKSKELQAWVQEQVAEDAPDLYDRVIKAINVHLDVHIGDKGVPVGPSLKAVEIAADILKMRDPGGININQNFGGNTTINNNNGTTVSFEDIIRKQQAREVPMEIIEAEFTEPDVNSDTTATQG